MGEVAVKSPNNLQLIVIRISLDAEYLDLMIDGTVLEILH
jgi:hypothetical protein